jgi:hypothetical protein
MERQIATAEDAPPLSLRDVYADLMDVNSMERTIVEQLSLVTEQQFNATKGYTGRGDDLAVIVGSGAMPKTAYLSSFDRARSQLELAKTGLQRLQESLRERANQRSRFGIRNLSILDLPDEILRQIFANCGAGRDPENLYYSIDDSSQAGKSRRQIGMIRLTCRRFNENSGHLLLDHVDVAMNPESIAHLEEVSKHPLISKGIRALRVHFDYYSAEPAEFLEIFTPIVITNFEEKIEAESGTSSYWPVGASVADKAWQLIEEWGRFLDEFEASEGDQEFIKAAAASSKVVDGLVKAQQEYRELRLAQDTVTMNGAFGRAIANAMEKMPCARKLYLGDNPPTSIYAKSQQREKLHPLSELVDDPRRAASFAAVLSQDWDTARSRLHQDLPTDIFADFLRTILAKSNEIGLDHLEIALSGVVNMCDAFTKEDLQDLQSGTGRLQVLDIKTSIPTVEPPDEEIPLTDGEVAVVGAFVSALVSGTTKSLKRLALDFHFMEDDYAPKPPVGMGYTFTCRPLSGLSVLDLEWIPLHLENLTHILGDLTEPVNMRLDGVQLLSGTWEEALDIIRESRMRIGTNCSLGACCRGAECDYLDPSERMRIFADKSLPYLDDERWGVRSIWGTVPDYIAGISEDNPFRERRRMLESFGHHDSDSESENNPE